MRTYTHTHIHTETSITGRICRRSFSPPILLNVSASALATVAFPRLLTMPIKAVYLVDTKEKCFQTAKGIQLGGRARQAFQIDELITRVLLSNTYQYLIFVSRTDVDSVIDLTTSEPILLESFSFLLRKDHRSIAKYVEKSGQTQRKRATFTTYYIYLSLTLTIRSIKRVF